MKVKAAMLPIVLGLTGCSAGPSEDQMAALNGCTSVWRSEFANLYGEQSAKTRARALAVMEPEEIQFDGAGRFEFKQPPNDLRESYDMQFSCNGNIETRTISLVRANNQTRGPAAGTEWSF